MVHRVERYNIKGKDTISGNCKFYLNDLSYRNYLYSGYGYGFGCLLENAVYLSLRRAGYQVYVGSIKDAEVDFVAIKGDKKLYLQVTLQLTEEQTVESNLDLVVIREIDSTALLLLVNFIYSGQIMVNEENVQVIIDKV